MNKIQGVFLSRLLVTLLTISTVRADIITFAFEGELTEVGQQYEEFYSTGNHFYGIFEFSTDLDESDFNSTGYGEYLNAISLMFVSIEDNNHYEKLYTASSGKIIQDNDHVPMIDSVFNFPISSSPEELGVSPTWVSLWWSQCGFIQASPNNGLLRTPDFATSIPEYCDEGAMVDNGVFKMGFTGSPSEIPFLEDSLAEIQGKLNSVTLVSRIPTITISNNKWVQIGLNTAPPTGSTVADIIGDDITAPYGIAWILYSYDTNTNTYKKLSLTDIMHPGVGYWFIQTTGNSVIIDMPEASTTVNLTQHSACTSIVNGCFEVPLQTNSINAQWQMIGYPFRDHDYKNIDKLRIITAAGACRIGCTIGQAKAEGLVDDTFWHYDGNSYQQLTHGGTESFEPWNGAWIATLPAATGLTPRLLIPAPATN